MKVQIKPSPVGYLVVSFLSHVISKLYLFLFYQLTGISLLSAYRNKPPTTAGCLFSSRTVTLGWLELLR